MLEGDRLSRLSRASLRINESLDVETALRAVMDGARSLTRAPYSVIVTLDGSGRVEDHLVVGLDPGDVEQLWQAPEGKRFFEYLNALQGPLRAGQLAEFTESIGLGEFRSPVPVTGQPAPLTPTEYNLLAELARRTRRRRRARRAPQPAAQTGMEPRKTREPASATHPPDETPPQTRRQPPKPQIHPHRTPRRLPDTQG